MNKLLSTLLFFSSAFLPIYIFGPGGMQPAHLIFAVFAGFVIIIYGITLEYWSLIIFSIFIHSFIVECSYFMVGGELKYLFNSIFFFYNYILTAAVYVFIRNNGLSSLVPGIFAAAGIALSTILVNGVDLRELSEAGRPTGTFNNPNQLGYFSVCLLSLTYLFYRHNRISYWVAAMLFGVSVFLSIASLSKAAMLANFAVVILALKPASSRVSLLIWSVGTLVGMAMLVQLYLIGAFDEYLFMERLVNITNERDSSLESRGYFAFLEGNFLQLVFGLGTQGAGEIVGHEVHSTLGSVLNNYGFVGLLLFSTALALWAVNLWKCYGFIGMIGIAGPAMLYGVTHNGIRFTIFWLLFASSMAMAREASYERSRQRRHSISLNYSR